MAQPSTLIAVEGLLANDGLDNAFVNTLFSAMYSTTIISKAQTAITDADAVGVDISDLGNNIMPGLVGNVPSTYATVTPTSILRTAYYNHATTLFASGDISGFGQFFAQAFGYASQCYAVTKDVTKKNTTNLSDYGAKVTNHSDISSGGLTGFLTVNSQENLTKLGNDFIAMGTVFDYDELELYGTARGLAKQLIEAELALANPIKAWISNLNLVDDIDYYDERYEDIFYELLSQITIDSSFYQTFQYTVNEKLENLSDVLLPKKALSNTSNLITFNSFTEVAQALNTFTYLRLKDNIAFGNTIKQLSTPGTLSNLDTVTTPVQSASLDTLVAQLGTGTGLYGQPDVRNILGPVSGYLLESRLTGIVTALAVISASSDGLNLIDGYERITNVATDVYGTPDGSTLSITVPSGIGAGSYASYQTAIDAIETELDTYYNNLRSFLAIGSLELRQACETVHTDYDAIAKQVSESKSLISKAGIDTANFSSNKNTILGFANNLESFGVDAKDLGTRDILLGMVEENLTGDAIKSSLIAGQNQTLLNSAGIIPQALQG
jgi:hypothetical protein